MTKRDPASDERRQIASQMKSWAIALNFAWGVMGMGLLGFAIQTWLAPTWAPWPLLICLGAGLLGGFVRFVKDALAANRG